MVEQLLRDTTIQVEINDSVIINISFAFFVFSLTLVT